LTRLAINIGSMAVQIEADDPKDALVHASFFAELPTKCPMCGDAVRPFYRQVDKFKYWGLVCSGSEVHENTFGQHQDDGRLFYKHRAWIVKPVGAANGEPAPDPTPPPAGAAATTTGADHTAGPGSCTCRTTSKYHSSKCPAWSPAR